MKKPRFKKVYNKNGTLLGRVKTIFCKTPEEFLSYYPSELCKNMGSISKLKPVRVKPILNSDMLPDDEKEISQ